MSRRYPFIASHVCILTLGHFTSCHSLSSSPCPGALSPNKSLPTLISYNCAIEFGFDFLHEYEWEAILRFILILNYVYVWAYAFECSVGEGRKRESDPIL